MYRSCFQSFSENENECPACMPNNKKWLDIIRVQEQSRDLHETFHSLLDRAEDPFSLVADYFGRGVYKKLMVIAEWQPSEVYIPSITQQQNLYYNTCGPGAEAKIQSIEEKTPLGNIKLNFNSYL